MFFSSFLRDVSNGFQTRGPYIHSKRENKAIVLYVIVNSVLLDTNRSSLVPCSFVSFFFDFFLAFLEKRKERNSNNKKKKVKNDGNTVPNCFSFNNNLILLMFTANYPRKKLPNASVRVSFSKQKVFKCVLKRMNGTNGEYKCCEIVQVVPCFQQSPCFLRQFLPAFSTLTIWYRTLSNIRPLFVHWFPHCLSFCLFVCSFPNAFYPHLRGQKSSFFKNACIGQLKNKT